MTPRNLNYAQAVEYLGTKRDFFDRVIKPNVKWTPAGTCMMVERVDLDRAWEEYVARRAKGEKKAKREGQWHAEERPASTKTKRTARGRSTSSAEVLDFEAAFAAVTKPKPGSSAGSPS